MKKNILIVSNNVLSETTNNGKTLYSFFKNYDNVKISNLYFSDEIPTISKNDIRYFKVSDVDLVKKIINKNDDKVIRNSHVEKKTKSSKIKQINAFRLFREALWLNDSWKSDKLEKWMKDQVPDHIFFCAGDSLFAYEVVRYFKFKFNCNVSMYITDDYIIDKFSFDVFWKIKRYLIEKKMRETLIFVDNFFTVSPMMQERYKLLLNKDSEILVNIPEIKKSAHKFDDPPNVILYAGGLHLGRDKILINVAKSLKLINEKNNTKFKLEVYSNQIPDENILNKINILGHSEFKGGLDKNDLINKLNENIIPLFVESFNKKFIHATQLSLSTKIPEYLSLNKTILAIGPSEISSMDYLKNVAFCIYDDKFIFEKLEEFLKNIKSYEKLTSEAYLLFEKNHNETINRKKIIQALQINS